MDNSSRLVQLVAALSPEGSGERVDHQQSHRHCVDPAVCLCRTNQRTSVHDAPSCRRGHYERLRLPLGAVSRAGFRASSFATLPLSNQDRERSPVPRRRKPDHLNIAWSSCGPVPSACHHGHARLIVPELGNAGIIPVDLSTEEEDLPIDPLCPLTRNAIRHAWEPSGFQIQSAIQRKDYNHEDNDVSRTRTLCVLVCPSPGLRRQLGD